MILRVRAQVEVSQDYSGLFFIEKGGHRAGLLYYRKTIGQDHNYDHFIGYGVYIDDSFVLNKFYWRNMWSMVKDDSNTALVEFALSGLLGAE